MGVKYLFSACLLGISCRYDGENSARAEIIELFLKEGGIPVCPEQLGGLPTPRLPAQFSNGDGEAVWQRKSSINIIETGEDITNKFIKGAQEVLKIAKLAGIKKAYLKDKSPSCGVTRVYVNGIIQKGKGVTTALLEKEGIKVEGIE